jgi:uncharacterized protein (TIGR03067 family)
VAGEANSGNNRRFEANKSGGDLSILNRVQLKSIRSLIMTKICSATLALGLLLAAAARCDDAKKEAEKFQGAWKAVKFERGGENKDDAEGHQLIFSGDEFTIKRGDKVMIKGKYKIDAAKTPKEIDMEITEDESPDGKNKGKTAKAIYLIEGDGLKWCVAEPGTDDRPKEFATQAGTKHIMVTFKREK